MGDQDSSAEKLAMTVVGTVVTAVLVGAMGLGVSQSLRARQTEPPSARAPGRQAAPVLERLDFDKGRDQLPDPSDAVLSRVARAARQDPMVMVRISGFYDNAAQSADSEELARRRIDAVRHALEANGVAPRQLHAAAPLALARKARRVELDLRP